MVKALRWFLFAIIWLEFSPSGLLSQDKFEDYERFRLSREKSRNQFFIPKIQPRWSADGEQFWYRRELPQGGSEVIVVDAKRGTREVERDPQKIAELKNSVNPFLDGLEKSKSDGESMDLVFTNQSQNALNIYWINSNGQRKQYGSVAVGKTNKKHTYAGHVWLLQDPVSRKSAVLRASRDQKAVTVSDTDLKVLDGESKKKEYTNPRSPDGKWEVSIRESNVFFRKTEKGADWRRLSSDGKEGDAYQIPVRWAPDSAHFVVLKRKAPQKHLVHFVESSPADQLQPKLHSNQYLKPGDEIAETFPHLFSVKDGEVKEIPVETGLCENAWTLSEFAWLPDSTGFTFLYNQRGHQVLRVLRLDSATGKLSALIEEKSATFVDYAGKRFSRMLKGSGEWIWMSERDGWNHLYLYDTAKAAVKNQITKGDWVVRSVDRVDEEKRQIWFWAGGVYPEQDPYHLHYCRVNFDGSDFLVLTDGDGTHEISFSRDRNYLLATYSRVDLPPVIELRRASDGSRIVELERGTAQTADSNLPKRFTAKGRDGETDIYGIIFPPTDYDPDRSYPVVEKIYAGPHSAHVPKEFRPWHSAQALSELGFFVVQIDGMGTSHRSKSFHDVAWKNLKDAGFPDRISWIKAAAKKFPGMDLSRVGIYGGSAGGQNAMAALLWHNDFYRVAVADCGCHDNRMDKIWWNELWMGWPVDKSYEESSNVVNAAKLQGKLLLTVGELDKNVDPASTMQVANSLIKSGKDFDMIVVPGAGHGVGDGSEYMRRKRAQYFVRHLHGIEPAW